MMMPILYSFMIVSVIVLFFVYTLVLYKQDIPGISDTVMVNDLFIFAPLGETDPKEATFRFIAHRQFSN